ncbi:MAG: TOBE domain-containing protein, partial [Planctomycetes bacterium]|nr:TOBE domain-containing protein [Planctomycetota bacterium]
MANRLCGTIVNVIQGQIHAHVQILWKDTPLSVIITKASCDDMCLSVGD